MPDLTEPLCQECGEPCDEGDKICFDCRYAAKVQARREAEAEAEQDYNDRCERAWRRVRANPIYRVMQ